ncbi:serine/threonine-protein phosphatase 4 regulatory subunit 4-like isoform X2 [Anthonomus grandis grandis]|uniref:serine/threonine-protein phosphatase 4 regulatory subunit 4-like isoform X2 n=1 Tax=Anthonomus grandis grandis TaxID=2921223 RepID=UPI002166469C|nr:serine/threonine-protein phosphatase 4 regulatory subunit 4-like isoform X2 [Anthonomus grandis grandis]
MSDDDDEEWSRKFLEEEERLLTKGDELQKLSVIGSLPELLKYDQKGTVAKIIPKIQQELPNSSSEFSLAVSRMFNILINMDIPVNLVPQILQGLENRDPIIANAWMDTLLAVIPVLKEHIIKNEVLKCAIAKSQLSKAAYFRVSSCKILGQVSVHKTMNPFEVKKDVLPLVQSLCQDCFYEVRAAMCKELPNVAQGLYNLGDAIVKVNLLPLLVELSSDENIMVRSVAIESVVSIIPFLSIDTIKGTIIPLIKKLCTRSASEGDTTYISIASVFDMLINNLQTHMSPGDSMWFLDYFNHISKKGLSLIEDIDTDPSICMLCREHCASCLAKVAMMVQSLIPQEISGKWYHTFKALAADPCYIVRKAVATRFAEVVKILAMSNKVVVIDLTKLLRDEDEEVLQALVPNLGRILELFTSTGVLQREIPVQSTLDIGRAMLKCQHEAFRTNNWRMKESLLIQWERLPNCFPSDFIHQHFSPVVLAATVNGRARPVRSQATRTLLIFLKYSVKENHRKWIREMIVNQLCSSQCCYSRQMFITLCTHALDIFSWKYFKEHFYLPLLSLAEDPISIVRLSMVKLCPMLKLMLTLPQDRALQLKLENILSKMEMMESDKDVIMMLKQKLREMRTFRGIKNEVLVEDKRRMDEEDKLLKGKWTSVRNVIVAVSNSGLPKETGLNNSMSKDLSDKPAALTVPKPGTPKVTNSAVPVKREGSASPMPFLDQHFYIDAGVSLPQEFVSLLSQKERDLKSPIKTSVEVSKLIESAENLTSWLDEISFTDNKPSFRENRDKNIKLEPQDMVISVENVNPAETLTENDVKALQTTTTNMTDDLKVNIQSVDINPRYKRNSCIFTSELRRSIVSKSDSSLKRRSLHLPNVESKIPISRSYKAVSEQALDLKKINRTSRLSKSAINLKEKKSRDTTNSSSEALSNSRIPSKVKKDYVADNIRRYSTSDKTTKPYCFKRYSASDTNLHYKKNDILEFVQNNNVDSQENRPSSSNAPNDNAESNSGLHLSVKRKGMTR